ncbi:MULTISPECIES: hypothetical protein [unclassified Rahnella]|uniref:hypothetical protein n=1 Tax=unclassified Rahnella TaxID=2635087 RepID=UPI000DD30600|nr:MULTISPECIES: hypothetical protein [unclassified Rahnella]
MKMDPVNQHNLPYWWSAALGFFSLLSLQDYVFIIGAVISAFFTIKTYYAKRKEEADRMQEERLRTQILKDYIDGVAQRPVNDRPASAEVITEAMTKIEG